MIPREFVVSDLAIYPTDGPMAEARAENLRLHAVRAVDDPVTLARAARIVREALARKRLSLADLTDDREAAA